MKSTRETLEGNKVRLSVEIDETDFDRDIDAAFNKIAREVRLPGFRQGKAPRKVLEARIGLDAARSQALNDSIPSYLARAVRENDVDIIATPEIEITGGQESGTVSFTATCEVRPVVDVPGYAGLRVEIDVVAVTDDDIDAVVLAERRRLGTLVDVSRPAQEGDFVTVDLVGSRDGEPVVGLAVDDWSYEIGKKWVCPSFDEQLVGAVAGAELSFTDTPNGTEEAADFSVKVTAVQELSLPEADDAWVSENVDGFDTLAAWRDAVRERMDAARWDQARGNLVEKVTDRLAELVTIDPPESMVAADLQNRVQNVVRQFSAQGMNLEQWLQATGQEPADFVESFRPQSVKAAKVDLALRAVVVAQGLAAGESDVERELAGIAQRTNENAIRQQLMSGSKKKPKLVSVDQVRAAYVANDALVDLAAEIGKSKALDWLVHHVEYVDAGGNVLDSDTVVGHSEADHDHDHEHDHDHDHDGDLA
ncbi:MAG: trigger factor [Actinomycetota bacterium]